MAASPAVVLVTGCSNGGIGFALCEEYARQGCKVYATARRVESMDAFTAPNIAKLTLDVTKEENVQEVVETIVSKEGRIDVLVNNAGVLCVGPVIDVPMEIIERTYDTNVFAIIRLCKAVIPHMARRRSGTIVNISSIGALIPTPWAGIYGSTKAAVQSLSDVLYMECKPHNISVLVVTTGGIRSKISENQAAAFPGLPEGTLYKRYLSDIVSRIHASQTSDAMPAEVYARQVVEKSLQKSVPREMTLGAKVTFYRILMWFPRAFTLSIFWYILTKNARRVS